MESDLFRLVSAFPETSGSANDSFIEYLVVQRILLDGPDDGHLLLPVVLLAPGLHVVSHLVSILA